MTYEERKATLCKECGQEEVCGFYLRSIQDKCEYLQNVMYGWELGQQDTLLNPYLKMSEEELKEGLYNLMVKNEDIYSVDDRGNIKCIDNIEEE